MPVMSNWSSARIPDSFPYHPSSVILSPALVILSPSHPVILSPAGGGIDSAQDLVFRLRINSAKDHIAS
jgi:hypothetical protein